MWRVRVIVVVLVMCMGVSLRAAVRYVAPGGDDTGPGTLALPWRTLSRANAAVQPGDTVYVRAGTYGEQLMPAREGVAGRPIVYSAMPGENVVIEGIASSLQVVVLAGYTTVEGFSIKSQAHLKILNTVEYWVQLTGNHNTLRRCRVVADGDPAYNYWTLQALSRGVAVSGQHNIVEHCYIRGQVMGIVVAGGLPRFTVIRFDTLHSHGASNLVILSHENNALFDRRVQGTLVEDCEIDTSWEEDNIQFEPNYLDRQQTYNIGTIIRRSRLGHAAENCIDFKGAESILVDSCLLYSSEGDDNGRWDGPDDSGGAGIELGTGDVSRYVIVRRSVIWDNHTGAHMYEGYRYYNNIFLNNRRSYRGPNGTYANNDLVGAALSNKPRYKRAFLNNIVGMQPNHALLSWRMDYGDKFELNNNLYFDTGGPAKFSMQMAQGMVMASGVATWQNNLNSYPGYAYLAGKDDQAVEADPQFVNVPLFPINHDPSWSFGLRPGSPAIDAGRPVTTSVGSGTGSVSVQVEDVRFFCDGFGVTDGDMIKIGETEPVRIVSIDTLTNTIALAESRTWNSGAGVHLAFEGTAPDIGVQEFVNGLSQAPPVPQLSAPADGATNLQSTVSLSWAGVTGALSYTVQVSTTRLFNSPLVNQSGISSTTYAAASLGGNTTYFWRVRSANDSDVSGWSSVRSFTTASIGQVPATPSTLAPAAGATGVTTNPQLAWNAVQGATGYSLQVALESSFTTLIVDQTGITNTTYGVDGLKNGTTYYWRVSAKAGGGISAWSPTASLATFDLPPSFGQNAVTNPNFESGTTGWTFFTDGDGRFAVEAPGYHRPASAKVYITQNGSQVELYQDGLVMSPDSNYRLSFAASSNYGHDLEVSVLKGATPFTYYGLATERVDLRPAWKTYSVDFKPGNFLSPVNDVRLRFWFGPYAAAGDLYAIENVQLVAVNAGTPPPPPDELPSDYFMDENYPNPFNPATTIRYSVPRDVHVSVKVHNLLGQEVATLVDGFQQVGTYEVRLDMSGFASGMYLYTLVAGDYRQTRKLMYVK
jgi:hypothetical protein